MSVHLCCVTKTILNISAFFLSDMKIASFSVQRSGSMKVRYRCSVNPGKGKTCLTGIVGAQ